MRRWAPLAIGIGANVLGGSTYLIQKTALTEFPPAMMVVLRTSIALPLLFLAAPRGWSTGALRSDWWRMALVGTLGQAAPHLIGNYGLRDTASLNGAILIGMEPITIVLLSVLVLREKISSAQLAGIGLALIGATLIVTNGDLSSIATNSSSRGNFLLAVSGALWAIYTIAAKPTLERVPPIAVAAVTSSISLVVLVPASAPELAHFEVDRLTFLPIASVIALGLLVSFAGTVMWNTALRSITPTQMGALVFVQPVVGTLLGVLAGDPLPPALLFGAPLIFAGIYLAELKPDRR